jgi:hypothetical protein
VAISVLILEYEAAPRQTVEGQDQDVIAVLQLHLKGPDAAASKDVQLKRRTRRKAFENVSNLPVFPAEIDQIGGGAIQQEREASSNQDTERLAGRRNRRFVLDWTHFGLRSVRHLVFMPTLHTHQS